mmetsp:Transcript_2079/g.3850  ORF Transcript_2079/g.3850 Transcript_2079/m.3850 type:complete len:262 (-) Transcript_2079:144-929(-)
MHLLNPSDQIDQGFFVLILAFIIFAAGGPLLKIPLFGRSSALMSYSKFASKAGVGAQVSSRLGMSVLYAPSSILGALAYLQVSSTYLGKLAALMMFLHFGKRVFECNCVHKFSGTMPLATSLFISLIYCVASTTVCYYSELVGKLGPPSPSTLQVALLLFGVGLLGNLYHHHLLATLRKPGEKGYKVPQGGLFPLVAAPHYLFELVGWSGVAILCNHATVWFMFFGMVAYLADRARAQTSYNLKKIDGYPQERLHLIPYVF